MMDRQAADAFAAAWVAHRNAGELAAILGQYADDVRFRSLRGLRQEWDHEEG